MQISQKLKNFYSQRVKGKSDDYRQNPSTVDSKTVGASTALGLTLGATAGYLNDSGERITIDNSFSQPFTSPVTVDLDLDTVEAPAPQSPFGPIFAPQRPTVDLDLKPAELSQSLEVPTSVVQGAALGGGAGLVTGVAVSVLHKLIEE